MNAQDEFDTLMQQRDDMLDKTSLTIAEESWVDDIEQRLIVLAEVLNMDENIFD